MGALPDLFLNPIFPVLEFEPAKHPSLSMGQCEVIIWRNRLPDLNGNENGSGRVFLQARSRTNYHSRCRGR